MTPIHGMHMHVTMNLKLFFERQRFLAIQIAQLRFLDFSIGEKLMR